MIRTLRQAVISSRKGHPIGGGCHSPWRTCGSLAFLAFSTTASTMFHHQPLHFRSTLWPRIQGADALKGREAVQLDASSSICHHFTTDAAGDMKSPFVHEDPKITEVEANKFGIDGTKYRLEVHSYPNTSLNPQAVIAPREVRFCFLNFIQHSLKLMRLHYVQFTGRRGSRTNNARLRRYMRRMASSNSS